MWFGDGPRYAPSLALASHFGMNLFAVSEECRAKTGQPNVCMCLRNGLTATPVIFSSHDWVLPGEGNMLLM